MGIIERKEREKDEMRKLILDAAFEMFLKEGYSGTSLRLIAKKIEYSPGTIYLYYKDKNDLFFDIQSRCFANLISEFKKIENIKNPFERLKKIGLTYMDHNIRKPQCFDLIFLHEAPLDEFNKKDRFARYGNGIGFLTLTVKECIDKKQIEDGDPLMISLEIWGLVHGLTTLFLNRSYEGLDMKQNEAREYIELAYNNFLNRIKK